MAGMFARACVVKVLLLLLTATLASGSHVHHGRDRNSLTRGRVKFVYPAFSRAFSHLPRYPVTGKAPNRSHEARNFPTLCFQVRSTAGSWRLSVARGLSGPARLAPSLVESFEPVAMNANVF